MALTPSTMAPLGSPAPDFALPDTTNNNATVTLADFADARALLVIFICNHCPFVIHVQDELARIAKDYAKKGLRVVAISSNNVATHPDDAPDKMAQRAIDAGFTFPYLYDESQRVAQAYTAACTPDFFLYDADQRLSYRGRLDDSRPSNGLPVTGEHLRAAIDAALAGEPAPADQAPSAGCNIKWKPGNEPAYYATA